MNKEELITYIKSNIDLIYNTTVEIFGFNKEEFKTFIINLVQAFEYNKQLIKKDFSENIFSKDNLIKLTMTLEKMGLNKEEKIKIIIKSPIIVLYSDELDEVFYLYKNNKYYGYTILDNKEFYTYLLNDNLDSNIVSNNYITEKMLEYHKVSHISLEEFEKLESDFKLKNYYFKKRK